MRSPVLRGPVFLPLPPLSFVPSSLDFRSCHDDPHDPHDPRPTSRSPREGLGREPALEGHQAQLQRRRRGAPARLAAGRAHAGATRRRQAVDAAEHRALRQHAGRAHRQPGHAAGQGRAEGHLPLGLAGRGGRQRQRRDVPRPVAVLGGLGAQGRQAHQQRLHPRRPDPVERGQGRHRLLRAHRGRCRGGLRRRAQRLRADEGDDRGGRSRRALRGPAGLRQEVRPHGWQGAGAHPRGREQAGGRTPGRRRHGHTPPSCWPAPTPKRRIWSPAMSTTTTSPS